MNLEQFRGKRGIYAIINKTNGKAYVGSSQRDIYQRLLYEHISLLEKAKHPNQHLQNAWKKYGKECFEFALLEASNDDHIESLEQKWIDTLKSADKRFGYNIAPFAGSSMKGRRHSLESKQKKSESKKGKQPWLGKTHTDATKQKLSAARKGKPGTKHSASTIQKMKEGAAGRVIPLETRLKMSQAKRAKSKYLNAPDGMSWCAGHSCYHPKDCFCKHAGRIHGLNIYCRNFVKGNGAV